MKFFPFKKKNLRYSQLLPTWRTTTDAKFHDWRTDRAIREGLKSSTYVYACISLIAKSVASVPWHVYKQKANGDWLKVDNHPLQLLIEKPTPWHSRKDLMTGMVQHLYLGGNSIHTKVKTGGIITELWQLPPDWIRVIPDKQTFINRYEYRKDGILHNFAPDEIMHNKFNDPANPFWGLAPLQAGARAVDTDIEATKFQKISLQNRAITDGIFTFEHPLTKEQWDEAREMVKDQHMGMDNARTPWVLGAGANWQQMSLSPAEMDFLNSRKFTREEICTVFQVPPPMVGVLEKATYQNIETARKIFWQDTVVPLLEDIKDCFNLSLTPEFGQGIEISYDLSNIEALQETTAERITQAKDLFAMGVPFNMINQKLELGFDDIAGGDIGYLGSGLVPANSLEVTTLQAQRQLDNPDTIPDPNAPPPQADNPKPPETPPKGIILLTTKDQRDFANKGINLKSEHQKDFYSEQVHRKRSKWVTNMTRKSAQLFEQEGKAVAEAVKNGDWKKTIDKHKANWESFLVSSYRSIATDIGQEHFTNLIKSYEPKYRKSIPYAKDDGEDYFDPYNEIITDYITEIAATKITLVSDWTKQIIASMVQDQQTNDQSMDDLAKAIMSQYKEFSRYRSYRIARTETQNALGFSQFQAGKQAEQFLGEKLIGEWWTSLDDRVRKSHEELHGEKRALGEPFGNGLIFAGEYQNDQGGANNINCRCVILHHFESEGE